MKLKYLGTAAAEGIPAVFCNCPVCRFARENGGRDVRSRSQTLINDDLMIDFGPDTLWHVANFKLDLTRIRTVLITHAHEDHYAAGELHYRKHGYAYLRGDLEDSDEGFPRMDVCISKGSYRYACVKRFEKHNLAKGKTPLDFKFVKAFRPFTAGKYEITPLKAHHAPGYEALIYAIGDGKSTLLYAHDTGLLPEETYDYLQKTKPRFDFVSLDCTGMASGHNTGGGRHMNLERNIITRDRLMSMGCADEKTVWCCNHFSHNGKSNHAQLTEILAGEGFLTAYDGMEAEF